MNAGFVTSVGAEAGKTFVRLLADSIRTFGGALAGCPIWVFATRPEQTPCDDLAADNMRILPLAVAPCLHNYPFGEKVAACAAAEALADETISSLIWLDLACVVVRPPVLLGLDDTVDAAVRPVHLRNVGLPVTADLDAYWAGIYAELGIGDVTRPVTTFIGADEIRAYFNSHGFSVRPSLGLMQRWRTHFERLVADEEFQQVACADQRHRIFLFQALLSALIASEVDPRRLRVLPNDYNYPYNLHGRVPAALRPRALSDLTCFTFEGRTIDPERVVDVEIHGPLRSWLAGHPNALDATSL